MRVNIGQGEVRQRVGIFRDRKTQATTTDAGDAGDDGEEYEDVWREMTEEDLAALSPEERKARKLQLGGQGAEAQPLEVRLLWLEIGLNGVDGRGGVVVVSRRRY